MKNFRRLFSTAVLAAAAVGIASADSVITTSTLPNAPTDITDTALAITPFTPGTTVGGTLIPVGSVLTGFTVSFNEAINGNLSISNSGTSTSTISGTVDSLGLLYLFTSAAAHGDTPINPAFPPSDDVFGGGGPDPSFKVTRVLTAGQAAGPFTYNKSSSAISGLITDSASLTSVQSAYNAYLSSATNVSTSATGSGNGMATYNNNVQGLVSVQYFYTAPSSTPEPSTMILFGSALVGLGLLRKRTRA